MNIDKSLGICIGASTISIVECISENNKTKIESTKSVPHHGNPREIIDELFSTSLPEKIAVTGRKFRSILNLTTISEPEAIEFAIEYLNLDSNLVISAGGENFIIYELDKERKISKSVTGNKCASGTGEFFLQQIKRMDLSVDRAVELGMKGEAYNISGRCSVFCKSDCTHALNKGVPKENVVAGLSKMMAQKVIELTAKSSKQKAILIGGVSKNDVMMKYLREHFEDIKVPNEAAVFEALGAAVFALKNDTALFNSRDLYKAEHASFSFHTDLKDFESKVTFNNFNKGAASANDICVLGLDVGSTTTKAALLRIKDDAVLASEYLRTNGDPIHASVECYKSLQRQINDPLKIIGLGVTGSGRYISGLHAQTKGIINEIIAHATATIHFDKDVDTIFEIGGQDAKYTYITAGVPSDYAMNEACSAGTGSFLEEAAKESLNIDYKEIGDIALRAKHPPNFNDQCSAFISSDIKNALHDGLSKDDIVAGLVYSICMNYANRVKGNRPMGKKIFMQGGVCYNKAVPIAMAALTGKEIIVPPEPGLMGAFGVALEIKNRINLGLMERTEFELQQLIDRKVSYGKSFVCAGGAEKCDRKCSVAMIEINGKKYPFGGACNKYYNLQLDTKSTIKGSNLVNVRQDLVFDKYIHPKELPADAKTIGIPKSFLVNTYYPLYYNFFTQLGFKIILGSEPDTEGIERKQAAFCYPVELAHGFFNDIIKKKPDYIFIPHILETFNEDETFKDRTCVLLQSEIYYLRTTFKDQLDGIEILSPVLNFASGYASSKDDFVATAKKLGISKPEATASFDFALGELQEMFNEFTQIGKLTLEELETDSRNFAVVLFGRSYNSFAGEANLGIPQKFTSRNITIIPHDFLPSAYEQSMRHMYWGTGNQLMKSANFVKKHDQLFGTFITNFSCGPDSFLISFFRNVMGSKPSLTLELDSHSADAGINTRIEAALDIIKSYRELSRDEWDDHNSNGFIPLELIGDTTIRDSGGEELSIFDKRVKMLIPNMGRFGTEASAASFRFVGINAEPLPIYTFDNLKSGRGSTTCKECLPLILNAGSMLDYCTHNRPEDERTLFFMAESNGPCRLGQYHVLLEEIIRKKELKNFGVFTLTDENSYSGLGDELVMRWWAAITVSDVVQDMQHAIKALAKNKNEAYEILENGWKEILRIIEKGTLDELYKQLWNLSSRLKDIDRHKNIEDAVKVALIGEIFVRNDEFSRVDLIERLAEKQIVCKVAPVGEYVYYSNYLAKRDGAGEGYSLKTKLKFLIRDKVQVNIEKKIKEALSYSGFVQFEVTKAEDLMKHAEHLIRPELDGEAILTVGSALYEIMDHVSGVISIGPFGCMPSRVAESILNSEMNLEGKLKASKIKHHNFDETIDALPFLAIETDGNLFPQIIQSKIEIFALQAARLHEKLETAKSRERVETKNKFLNTIYKFYQNKFKTPYQSDVPDIPGIASEVE